MPALSSLWENRYLTDRLGPQACEWVAAAVLTIGLPFVLLFLRRRLISLPRRSKNANATTALLMASDLGQRIKTWFVVALGLWLALKPAPIPNKVEVFLDKTFIILAFSQLAIITIWLLDWGLDHLLSKSGLEPSTKSILGGTDQAVRPKASDSLFRFLIRIVVMTALILSMLDNLGVEIKTLVTGLGIGGIAVALAVQNVLGDLLASLSIALDRPFEVGDVITVGPDHVGTVERIGIKTTRLKSSTGEQIIVSNNDLLQTRIRNFKRMEERRIVFRIGVVYETAYEKLQETGKIIREILDGLEKIRVDRVHLATLGQSSIDFEVAYYVLSAEYNQYMDIQEQINLGLLKRFSAAGIEFAYPTQTIMLGKSQTDNGADERKQ